MLAIVAALAVSTQGPVGYWRGDDPTANVALDSSGNGRNGTYVGGATTLNTPQPAGLFHNVSAFSLDGVNDEISIPHNAAFNLTGDMTVAFWMRKTAEATDWARVVGKGGTNVRTFGVWENPGNTNLLFQQYNGSGGAVLNVNSTVGVPLNTWTHVACVVSGSTATIYIGGSPAGSGTRSGAVGVDTEPVRVGFAGFHTYFPGQVDEVRLFNRALNDTEIDTLAGLIAVAAPTNLRTQTVSPDNVTITWDAAAGATSYVVQRSYPPPATPFATVTTTAGLTYTDTNVTWGETYAYRVYAIGFVDSADSNIHTEVIPFPPPRTEDHEEGFLDGNCACGASARPGALAWILAPLALLALAIRRS